MFDPEAVSVVREPPQRGGLECLEVSDVLEDKDRLEV